MCTGYWKFFTPIAEEITNLRLGRTSYVQDRGVAMPFLVGDKDAELTLMKSFIISWSNRPK